MNSVGASQPSARHGRILPFALGTLTALAPLSIDMYLPSLPAIQRDLGTTATAAQLTLAAFFAGMGVGQLVYGPLSDRFGRKRPLYLGLAIYVIASLGCALAPGSNALIAMRFAQAFGGAAGGVIARAVVRDLYRGRDAARLLSTLMLIMGAAPILAPLAGGWLLGIASWRAIFGVLTAFGLFGVIFTAIALPETGTPDSAAMAPRVLATRFGALLRDREFITAALAGGFASAGMFAYISGSPFVFIVVHQLSPRAFAVIFGTNAFGLIAASQINRRLLAHWRPPALLVAATTVMLVAGILLAVLAASRVGGAVGLGVALFAFVASIGVIGPNGGAIAMENQGRRAGLASALMGALQFAIAAAASSAVGGLNDGTARPMAFVMAICGAAACGLALVVRRHATTAMAPSAISGDAGLSRSNGSARDRE